MNQVKKLSGLAMASAAATLLLSGMATTATAGTEAKQANVKCSGINSCKGTSACATATSACMGQNSCKGTGWVKATKADCEAKGGKVLS